MINTENLETIKDLLIKYASAEVLSKALIQYMDDIEPSLDNDNYILNKFYVLENNDNNFKLLIDEFNIKTYEQIEKTMFFTVEGDCYIQPMKYLTEDNRWIWIIRSYTACEYLSLIDGYKEEIIEELIKHYTYINWNEAIQDIIEGEAC